MPGDSVLVGIPGIKVFVRGRMVPVGPGLVLIKESVEDADGDRPVAVAAGPSVVEDGVVADNWGVTEAIIEKKFSLTWVNRIAKDCAAGLSSQIASITNCNSTGAICKKAGSFE